VVYYLNLLTNVPTPGCGQQSGLVHKSRLGSLSGQWPYAPPDWSVQAIMVKVDVEHREIHIWEQHQENEADS